MTESQLKGILKTAGKGFVACSIEPAIQYRHRQIDKNTLISTIEKNFKNSKVITTKDIRLDCVFKILEANMHIEALKNIQVSARVEQCYRDLATKTLQNLKAGSEL